MSLNWWLVCIITIFLNIPDTVLSYGPNAARYDNYRLYSITPQNEEHIKIIDAIMEHSDSYIFIKEAKKIKSPALVIVAPHKFSEFTQMLSSNKHWEHKLLSKNVQADIDAEKAITKSSKVFGWDTYQTFESINKWMDEVVENYPTIATIIEVGDTYERRPIRGLKISLTQKNEQRKPGIFIEGGIHAREWISPAFVTYLANALVTADKAANETIYSLVSDYDWYLVPNLNPDGYVYTHKHDRMWRKTRQPHGRHCIGVDLNRNWDHHWAEDLKCSADSYPGPAPFSEIESGSLAIYLEGLYGRIHAYISFHSFSQTLLYPYGYTKELPSNHQDLQDIGDEAVMALSKRYGSKYVVGPISSVMYEAYGSTVDYVYDVMNVPIAYAYELRPSDREHNFTFDLPSDQIIPTCMETLDSIVALLAGAKKRGYLQYTN